MTERTMPPLERTIDQWRSCDPAMMAVQSIPAIRFALADAQHDILALAAENAALRALLSEVFDELDEDGGNAPGHGHDRAGIWDGDNGAKSGTACAWCATWARVRSAVQGNQS